MSSIVSLGAAAAAQKAVASAAVRASAIHVQSSKLPSELSRQSAALFSSYNEGNAPALPDLYYDYDALEPVISAETMRLHHTKHHNAYVTNLKIGLEKLDAAMSQGDVSSVISLMPGIKFNGGGHLNHSLFWRNLCPVEVSGELRSETAQEINKAFGSLENLQTKLSAASVAVQGSGWGWLAYNTETKLMQIATCANQDPLQATTGLIPLLGIDVWEHAYYVDYRNVRPDYVKNIWKIVHWATVHERLMEAKQP